MIINTLLMNIAAAFLLSVVYAKAYPVVEITPITKTECSYAETNGSLESHLDCLELLGNGNFKVRPEHLHKMNFAYAKGLAALYYQGGTAYVNRKGKIVRTFTFDNGPDYFNEGLARGISSTGKMGFINSDLNFVIAPQFDFVTPFEDGKAEFCNGCSWDHPDQEHRTVIGGERGTIDKQGRILPTPVETNSQK